MIEIKRWDNGEVIHSGEFASIKECLEDGVAKGVCFNYAELNEAELNHAALNGAELNCVLDYSAWPLWCGSTKAKVSDRIAMQLAYHAICVMSKEQQERFLADPIGFANGFHRVGELPKIEVLK